MHSGGAKFHCIVPHAEVNVIDGVHQESVLILGRGNEQIALYGGVGYQATEHDPGLFVFFAVLEEMFYQRDCWPDQFMGEGGSGIECGMAADARAMLKVDRIVLFSGDNENADHFGCALLAAELLCGPGNIGSNGFFQFV